MSSAVLHPLAAEPTADLASPGAFAADVARGLSMRPKGLPPKYFYDALGSQLFEAICALPWYRITRAERGLLARHGTAMITALPELTTVIELGCGSGEKLALLLGGLPRRSWPIRTHLIDISETALALSTRTVGALPQVSVVTHRAPYEVGMRQAAASRLRHGATLALFLGSNIGNFDPLEAETFLRGLRRMLRPGDGLLLGVDLVKPVEQLLLAYDDPLGVTAAFNKNLLVRINRELGGAFDLAGFDHQVRWNAACSRIEMHLVSRKAVRVPIAGLGLTVAFDVGETIWTESSYKYTVASIRTQAAQAGFDAAAQWTDEDAGFAVTLFRCR